MKTKHILLLAIGIVFFSCKDKDRRPVTLPEDNQAKRMLQGIWINQDDQSAAFQIKGDTLYYPDSTSQPMYFQVFRDTLVLHGVNDIKYQIIKQTPNFFSFRNQDGEEIQLTLSQDADDAFFFTTRHPKALNQGKVIKRDTVVNYQNERYHCYVQINPTTYKVVKASINDNGVEVNNFYYDNIVNLHIYNGSRKIFSTDFRKQAFTSKVPKDFLEQAVLSDLTFKSIESNGIHYIASFVIPDSMSSFEVEMIVSFNGALSMKVD